MKWRKSNLYEVRLRHTRRGDLSKWIPSTCRHLMTAHAKLRPTFCKLLQTKHSSAPLHATLGVLDALVVQVKWQVWSDVP